MVTNFSHLESQYKEMFDKMIFVEDMLVDGDSKEEYIQAMSAMRGVLDIMMKNWVRSAGISDAVIISFMRERFQENNSSVNLYGRIYALERTGMISAATADLLHDIRKVGNDSVHLGTEVLSMSKNQAYNRAVAMYTEMYKVSYEFAQNSQALPNNAYSYNRGMNNNGFAYRNVPANPQSGKKGVLKGIIIAVVIAGAILYIGYFISVYNENQRTRAEHLRMQQQMQQEYQKSLEKANRAFEQVYGTNK